MQADQLEPAVDRVRNPECGKEQRLPGLLDDALVGALRRVADRFASRKGDHLGARAPAIGIVDNRRACAEAVGLNWAATRPISTEASTAPSRANLPAMSAVRTSSLLVAIAAGAALSGCATTVEQRGNLPPPEEMAQIHPGKTTKDQVIKILGTPSSVSVFNDKDWYYISRAPGRSPFWTQRCSTSRSMSSTSTMTGVVRGIDHKTLVDGERGRAGRPRHPGARPRADVSRAAARQYRPVQRRRRFRPRERQQRPQPRSKPAKRRVAGGGAAADRRKAAQGVQRPFREHRQQQQRHDVGDLDHRVDRRARRCPCRDRRPCRRSPPPCARRSPCRRDGLPRCISWRCPRRRRPRSSRSRRRGR